jgi:hypothetical protein
LHHALPGITNKHCDTQLVRVPASSRRFAPGTELTE